MSVKKIFTDRLILIPFTYNIAVTISEGNLDVLENMGLKTNNRWPDNETIETLPKIIRNLELVDGPTGFESWLIIRQDNMAIIGDVGFKGLPHDHGEVDIGYAVIKEERKRGYGFESAKALADWAFLQPNIESITASCCVSNAASIRILKKLGMQEIAREKGMIYWKISKQHDVETSVRP